MHKDEREKGNHGEVVMYADDVKLVAASNVSEVVGELQRKFSIIANWCQRHRISLN